MTIQDLGSIGELVAAIATVVTLLYLALQVRANATALKGDARRTHRESVSATNRIIASDNKVAALFNTGLSNIEELQPEQYTQFSFLMAEFLGGMQAAHEEFESGIVESSHIQTVSDAILPFLRTPGGRKWWNTYGKRYPPSFCVFVDERIQASVN